MKLALPLSKRWNIFLAIIITLTIFTWLQSSPTLADPDSFYHTKLSLMMRDYGILREFPWTQDALYKVFFIDYHFLYHLILIPFVSLGNPLVGAKLATIFFASFSILIIIWLLHKLKTSWLYFWLLLLLTNATLLFRLSLVKAPSLSIGLSILGFYLIITKRKGWLFIYSWLFVWFYAAWPTILLMLFAYTLVSSWYDFIKITNLAGLKFKNFVKNYLKILIAPPYTNLWLSAIAGITSGLIINPYFPTNLLYLKQLFSMALINYSKIIGIGAEWYPYAFPDLIEKIAVLLLILVAAFVLFFKTIKKQSKETITALLITFIFFIYATRARRQIEYLVPWLVISTALILRDASLKENIKIFWQEFKSWLPQVLKGKTFAGFMFFFLVATIPLGLSRGPMTAYTGLRQAFPISHLSAASNWLAQNTNLHSIVFQSDWGTFPLLFYNNLHNYYLTGLDQTFMYEYDQDKYWAWVNATKGKRPDIYYVAKDIFRADWLLLETRRPDMLRYLNRDTRFSEVYQDDSAIIFSIK